MVIILLFVILEKVGMGREVEYKRRKWTGLLFSNKENRSEHMSFTCPSDA
jgi:hypothetical protein